MNVNDFEILQTKANFLWGEQEDFHERKSNGTFKIAYRPKFKLVLLFVFLMSKHDITVMQMYLRIFFEKKKCIP